MENRNWKEVKLGEVTTKIGSGSTPSGGSNAYKEEGISLIRSQNILDFFFSIDGLAFIDQEQAYKLRGVIVEENDVLFNITGDSVARACKVPNRILPARVNQHVAIIRSDQERLDNDFLLYLLQSKKEELLILSEIGATRNAITKVMLENLEIQLPPLPEQKAIASVLSSLDDKIDLLHQQNQTLEALAETLFRQWFIEKAKEDWEEVSLGSIIDLVVDNRGKTPPTVDYKTAYPLIEVNAINTSDCLVNYNVIRKYVVEETYNSWFRKHLKVNDVIVSTVGTIGVFSIFTSNIGCIAQNLIGLRSDNISPYFIYLFLKINKEDILNLDIGGVQPSIKVPHLMDLKFKKPNIEVIHQFHELVKEYFNKIGANQQQIQTLTQLRDTLLPKLMSGAVSLSNCGEVRVKL